MGGWEEGMNRGSSKSLIGFFLFLSLSSSVSISSFFDFSSEDFFHVLVCVDAD